MCLPVQEVMVWSLGWENPLEMEMATYFNIPAWEIPWTVKPGAQKGQARLTNYTTTVICKSRTESCDCTSQNIQPSKWTIPINKIKNSIKREKKWLYSIQVLGTSACVTGLDSMQVPVPKLNCFNAKEMRRRCQQMKLLQPREPGHSLVGNTSCRSCWAFLHPYQAKCIQRMVHTLGRKSFKLSPGLQPWSPFSHSFQAHTTAPWG